MDGANTNVIFFGIFLSILVVAVTIGGVVYLFSSTRQLTKAKLARFQARYAPQSVKTGGPRKAFEGPGELPTVENLLRRLVPRREVFRMRLAKTGKKITLVHYAAMILAAEVVSFLIFEFGFNTPRLLSLLLATAVALELPHLAVSMMINRRINAFIQFFPDTLDLIVRGLRSGLPISESMGSVAKEIPNPVGAEFRKVIDNIRLGRDMDTALKDVSQRIEAPEFKFFMITLAIQRETGGNLAETLAKLSDLLRRRQAMKLKIRAMASEGKASAYIVGSLPFVLFVFLLFVNYDYTSVLFTDPRAIIASVIGLTWLSIGGFIMSRLIAFEI